MLCNTQWRKPSRQFVILMTILVALGNIAYGCSDSTQSSVSQDTTNSTDQQTNTNDQNPQWPDGEAPETRVNPSDTHNDTDTAGHATDIQPPDDVPVFDPEDVVTEIPPESPLEALCCITSDQDTVCPMLLVRDSFTSPLPVALQFTFHWNPDELTFLRFQDEFCAGDSCFPVDVPPSGLFPSGHSVGITPKDPGKWNGFFGVLINTIAHPAPPMTDAWLGESAQIFGDPVFLEAVIRRGTTNTQSTPCLLIKDLAGSDARGFGLEATVIDGVIITRSIP